MKLFSVITVASAVSCGTATAQDWQLSTKQVTAISTMKDNRWASVGGDVESIRQGILSYTGAGKSFSGSWLSYFNGGDGGYQGYYGYLGDRNGALVAATRRTGATSVLETQFFTSFGLSEDALSAEKVKVSFSMGVVSAIGFQPEVGDFDNGDSGSSGGGIEIGVGDWDNGGNIIIGLSEAAFSATSLTQYYTQFTFGLINLATGEVYDALINGESLTFNGVAADSNLWTVLLDETKTASISFELTQEDLQSIGEEGLGLVIQSKASDGNYEETFSFYDFEIEYLEAVPIPEPSTYAVMLGLVTAGVVIFRRRKSRRQ